MTKENLSTAAAALKASAHRLQAIAALSDFHVHLDAPAIARFLIQQTHEALNQLYASANQLELALPPTEEQKGAPCPDTATTTALPEEHSKDYAPDSSVSNPTSAPPLKLKAKSPAKRGSRKSG